MKKMIKKIVLVVAVFISVLTYASDNSQCTKENTKLTHLSFGDIKEGAVIVIKNNAGLILYKESVKKSGAYSKDFDLTALPDGDYYFEVDKQFKIKIIPFTVISDTVMFNKEEEVTVSKPRVVVKGNNVFISRLALENTPLKIKIYYEGYDLVFSEALNNDAQRVKRIYDFSRVTSGNYEIVMESEGRTFIKNIKM